MRYEYCGSKVIVKTGAVESQQEFSPRFFRGVIEIKCDSPDIMTSKLYRLTTQLKQTFKNDAIEDAEYAWKYIVKTIKEES